MADFGSEFVVHHRRKGVTNASYSCINNSYFVTSFNLLLNSQGDSLSQTSLIIFDVEQGVEVHRITQANTTVNMATNTLSINQHPKYERVCITTDLEGQIIFWDCLMGVAIRIFVEFASHIGLPLETNSVSDSNFSKCGNFLVVGTNYGSISVYGYGGSDIFEHCDTEQFKLNDYEEINLVPDTYQIVGSNGLEVGTGQDIEVPTINLNGTYHIHLPKSCNFEAARKIMEEKANLNKYKLHEMKKTDENSQKDLKDILLAEKRKALDMKKKLMEIWKDGSTKGRFSKQLEGTVDLEQPLPTPIQPVSQPTISQGRHLLREMIEPEDMSSDSPINRRRLRRAALSESSVSEDDLREEPEDNDLELDFLDNEDDVRRNRRSTRLLRHTRRGGRDFPSLRDGPRTRRSGRLGEDAYLGKRDIADNSSDDSEEFYHGFGRARKIAKEKETPVVEEELFCTRCKLVGARERCSGVKEPCGNIYHHICSDLCGADVRDKFLCFDCLLDYYQQYPTNYDYSKTELEDAWLDIQGPDPDMMTPQIGDKYYFVFQAYEMFVSRFFDILNIEKGDVFWPWRKFPYFQDQEVLCQIEAIDYEFPRLRGKKVQNELKEYLTIIMKIKMRILFPVEPINQKTMDESDGIGIDDSSSTFEIKYFPVNDIPSFLVWFKTYEKRVKDYSAASVYSEIKLGSDYYKIKEVGCCTNLEKLLRRRLSDYTLQMYQSKTGSRRHINQEKGTKRT